MLFKVGDKSGTVTVSVKGTQVFYGCVFDGVALPEENVIINGAAGQGVSRLKTTLKSTDTGCDEFGKAVSRTKLGV